MLSVTVGAVLLIGGAAIFMVIDKPNSPPPPVPAEVKVPDKAAEVAPPPVPQQMAKQKPVSTVTREVSNPKASDKDSESLAELEQIFEFIHEAMATMPSLIEVDVHKPGVVFFRHKPDRPEALELAMEDLAGLYKDRLGYDKPVNVVFFISGRPVRSKVFFRE
jgi:hypothetical protein